MNNEELIYKTIIKYIAMVGYPPSFDEICEWSGIKSKSTISFHIANLVSKGKLETNGKTRAIKVVGYEFIKAGDEK